jgi:hypothetical protein
VLLLKGGSDNFVILTFAPASALPLSSSSRLPMIIPRIDLPVAGFSCAYPLVNENNKRRRKIGFND